MNEYGWKVQDNQAVLNLGTMKKAAIIYRSMNDHLFFIGHGSYFSFPNEYYTNKYTDIYEAIKAVNTYVSEWIEGVNLALINSCKITNKIDDKIVINVLKM